MFNSILIKRRPWWSPLGTGAPTSLSGGELAFNDVDQTLYYGLSTETAGISAIGIAGPGAFVSRTLTQDVSGEKTFVDKTYFNSNVRMDQDLTVVGNLSVLGEFTQIDTNVTTTSAFEITNYGSATALTVTQVDGTNDVAEFKDGSDTALIVKGSGYVGVGTNAPNEKLTVAGNLSASGNVFVDTIKLGDADNGLGLSIYDSSNTKQAFIGAWFGESSFVGTTNNTNLHSGGNKLTLLGMSGGFPADLSEALIKSSQTNITGALSAQGAVEFDSTLTVDGVVTINNDLVVTGTSSLDNGSITTDGAGTITGTSGVSQLNDFIIDGGTF